MGCSRSNRIRHKNVIFYFIGKLKETITQIREIKEEMAIDGLNYKLLNSIIDELEIVCDKIKFSKGEE